LRLIGVFHQGIGAEPGQPLDLLGGTLLYGAALSKLMQRGEQIDVFCQPDLQNS
jgi:hypothetical protein